jgi:hypothetical protein
VRRLAFAGLSGGSALGLALSLLASAWVSGAPSGASSTGGSAVTVTSTATRTTVVNGTGQTVSNAITLNVSQTANLQGRQAVQVSWSGAHPTGGVVANPNSSQAQYEEYPFVLLECRGIDSPGVAPAQQLTPQTCWTQTWTERYQDSLGDTYPPYRLDQYASPAPAPITGAPSPLPASCAGDEDAPVQYWVPFDSVNGTVYPGGNAGCAREAPESTDVGGSALPSNETFGVTGTNGSGNVNFDVFSAAENADLGCTQNVPCALVAVPIMGISCNPAEQSNPTPSPTDVANCEATGAYAAGSNANTTLFEDGAQLTVTGSLWWSPSNWHNRITVPLSFAPPPNACSLTGSGHTINLYGSELMTQATDQWDPSFCLNARSTFGVDHLSSAEPEARNLVATGGAEAALTSYNQTGGYGKPVVNAPVALTGFAVTYNISGANGQPYTSLRLTPRLLAKLLTESYPGEIFMQQEDPALADNPLNITDDPEFEKLNPGINPIVIPGAISDAASELLALSSDSDVMEALTAYINDDPAARAWLSGQPDQWGMTVNPAYKGIALPVDHWPLLSTFEPTAFYQSDLNDCLFNDPIPWQPLVAAPLAALESITFDMQYAKANSTVLCDQPNPGETLGEKLITGGQQAPGHQFMIGITPLADDDRYLMSAAGLQTTNGAFVTPGTTSLQAAAALLAPDPSTGTWPIPYGAFAQPSGAGAYPGTMVVYAAVPTSGLPPTDAQDYAGFLQFAVTAGQTPGVGVGELPPGYLPLTPADGLAALASYTQAAAVDVAAQNGQVPSVTGPGSSPAAGAPAPPPASAQAGGAAPVDDASAGSALFGSGPGLGGGLFSATSLLAAAGRAGAHPASGHRAAPPLHVSMISSALGLVPALWTSGFPIALIFGLGAMGAVFVPLTYRAGRRRGRW